MNIPVRRSRYSGKVETACPEQETVVLLSSWCEFTRLMSDQGRMSIAVGKIKLPHKTHRGGNSYV